MADWLARNRGYLFLSLVFISALGAVLFLSRRADPKPIQISTPPPRPSPTSAPSPTPVILLVQVNGAVANPGLMRLSDGARIDDAIKAAGGPTSDADLSRLNLAKKVSDGELIIVPRIGDPTPNPSVGTPTPRPTSTPRPTNTPTPVVIININTATVEELDRLPGIGPTTAQRIIEYRQANGPFQRIEDITKVRGISQAEFDAIKHLIVVK